MLVFFPVILMVVLAIVLLCEFSGSMKRSWTSSERPATTSDFLIDWFRWLWRHPRFVFVYLLLCGIVSVLIVGFGV